MPTHNTPINCNLQVIDDVHVLEIDGSICDDGIAVVREELSSAIGQGAQSLCCRMGDVDYISSSGIGMLVSILKRCHSQQINFAICELSDDISELFSLTRLDQVFTIASTFESWKKTLA